MVLSRPVVENDTDRIENLLSRLVKEWEAPHDEGEPIIIQEGSTSGSLPFHVYVVWNDWNDLSVMDRSRIIMRAAEIFGGREFANSVTLAMGFTLDEAHRRGIELT